MIAVGGGASVGGAGLWRFAGPLLGGGGGLGGTRLVAIELKCDGVLMGGDMR